MFDLSLVSLRLGAVFFFGLFHGLGFASGLLEAMREMQTGTMLLAILAFSIGIEARASNGGVTFIRFPESGASLVTGCYHAHASFDGVPADRVGWDFNSWCLLPLPGPYG